MKPFAWLGLAACALLLAACDPKSPTPPKPSTQVEAPASAPAR
ncbi:MAG: hypothetical protein AB1430_17435 [Pseudomonadota bacterium]